MPVQQETDFKRWVEEFTGGPSLQLGGTCVRPDVLSKNGQRCDACPYHEFCLCSSKRLDGEPRKKRPKHDDEATGDYHEAEVRDSQDVPTVLAALREAAVRLDGILTCSYIGMSDEQKNGDGKFTVVQNGERVGTKDYTKKSDAVSEAARIQTNKPIQEADGSGAPVVKQNLFG